MPQTTSYCIDDLPIDIPTGIPQTGVPTTYWVDYVQKRGKEEAAALSLASVQNRKAIQAKQVEQQQQLVLQKVT
jgi:hypothetical protein